MKLVALGDIADFINGFAFKPSDWHSQGKKIIRIQNLTDASKPFNHTLTKIPDKFNVTRGDLLVSWSATLDVFEWDDDDAYLNQHIFKVKEYKTLVQKRYLMYAIHRVIDSMRRFTHGSTMKHIVKEDFNNTKIFLPSIDKQNLIASLLDKASSLIQKRKETIRLADEFLRSTFLEMFGDPVKNEKELVESKIGKHSKLVSSGSTPLGGSNVYQNEGILFIRSQNVLMNRIELTDIAFISEEIHQSMKRTWVKNKDVLLNITGASIGRVAVYGGNDDRANVNQHVCIIRLNQDELYPEYLSYLISHPNYQKIILSQNAGATRQAFNFEQIKNFNVLIPEINLQRKFAEIVLKTETLKVKYKTSLIEMENQFNSLMQRAFRGEL